MIEAASDTPGLGTLLSEIGASVGGVDLDLERDRDDTKPPAPRVIRRGTT